MFANIFKYTIITLLLIIFIFFTLFVFMFMGILPLTIAIFIEKICTILHLLF